MKGTRGFTLVELMAAAMLAGAALLTALPLMLMAQRTARRLSGETAAAMRGDAVFELAAGELRYAESVSLSEKPWNRIGRLEGSGRTGQSAAEGASYPAVWYIDGGDS